jgi:hypothetical protein
MNDLRKGRWSDLADVFNEPENCCLNGTALLAKDLNVSVKDNPREVINEPAGSLNE